MAQALSFTQKELVLLSKTHPEIKVCAHEAAHDGARGWELRIQYQDKAHKRPQYMKLATARGNVRLFKNLETVIAYIKDHCPHTQEFVVYFGATAEKHRKTK